MAGLGVGTYNIHRCVGVDGRYDPERVITVLRQMDCSVIALQEVENRSDGLHTSLQLDHLADGLKMQAVPGLRLVRRWGDYGNALLTRHPVTAVARHNLSVSRLEPRGALEVDLDVDGRPLKVFATHMGLGRIERRYQTMQLLELFRTVPADLPCVVLGDFNEWLPWSRHLKWLHREFGATHCQPTFPSRWPLLKLDRIWVRPYARLKTIQVWRSAEASLASDHLPLRAAIDL